MKATGPYGVTLPAASTTVPAAVWTPSASAAVSTANERAAAAGQGCGVVYGSAQVPRGPAGATVCGVPPSIASVVAAIPPPSSLLSTTSEPLLSSVAPETSEPDSSGAVGPLGSSSVIRARHSRTSAPGPISGLSQELRTHAIRSCSPSRSRPVPTTAFAAADGSALSPSALQFQSGSASTEAQARLSAVADRSRVPTVKTWL